MAEHRYLGENEIHRPHNIEVADTAARLAYNYEDPNCPFPDYGVVLQLDDPSLWMVLDKSTPTFLHLAGGVAGSNLNSFNFSAGRGLLPATNSFLRGPNGVITSQSPFICPYNCTLKHVTASTNGNESWTAQIYVNGSVVPAADLVITSADKGRVDVSIDLDADDEISFYCNGTSISGPNVTAFFVER